MNPPPVSVAIAILYRAEQFLLQLRDDNPNILYPGHWGLFGGHLEPGETPHEALVRELLEEIDYDVRTPIQFRSYADNRVIRHVFHAPLTVPIDSLTLKEGTDLELVTPQSIQSGCCYSQKLGQSRPIGLPHRQILLDFLKDSGR